MRYLAIIPARGGSKGLPGKNIRPLCGKPLIGWSIEQAKAVAAINTVIVSTESEDIATVAKHYGALVPFMRPAHLAEDSTATEPVLLHALDAMENTGKRFDAVILLQPTSPFRHPESLASAIAQFEREGADSLLSVCESHHFFWSNPAAPHAHYDFENRPRRQDILPADRRYRENGSIYITKTGILRANQNRLCGKISMFMMTEEESWEIDGAADFAIVSCLMHEAGIS